MNHYPHHIGDYLKSTAHLNNEEDLCYRRLIELYYDTEKPIGLETDLVARRIRCEEFMVMKILVEFFTKTKEGHRNKRCDLELRQYHCKVKANRLNGKLGGRPKKTQSVSKSDWVNLANPTVTQNNLNQNQNQNHIKSSRSPNGSRLQRETLDRSEMYKICKSLRSELNPENTFEQFLDYWTAQPGSKGLKLDWVATWRNWVRNQKFNGGGNGKFNVNEYVNKGIAESLDASLAQKDSGDLHGQVHALLHKPGTD